MSRVSKTALGAATAGLCLFATATPALAKSEHVTGGHATVRAATTISAFLRSRGITVTPIGPAKVGKGTMSGGLEISAAWAKLINHLVGLNVVHTGETIGQLSMTIKMA